jgi:hypothetical protein
MTDIKIKNILFVQDSPACIRTIKLATALQTLGLNVHLVHRGETPNEVYGFGNDSFSSLNSLPKKKSGNLPFIESLIDKLKIDLIHFHNYPDKLGAKIIRASVKVPFVYDQHDFMSQKMKYLPLLKYYERICNEENDGAIYITENYRKLVSEKYKINNNNIVFGNYGLTKLIPKISCKYNQSLAEKKKIDAVYIGFITEHKGIVRYMVDIFKVLSNNGINIHIYPTRNKEYKKYKAIPNVTLHEQLPLEKLIEEICKYDFGITLLNHFDVVKRRAEEVKYGFWNKINDYLIAGIPVLTMDYYNDMSNFVKENSFGVSVKNLEDISFNNLKNIDVAEIRNNILENREKHFMENQINRVYEFYLKTLDLFNERP